MSSVKIFAKHHRSKCHSKLLPKSRSEPWNNFCTDIYLTLHHFFFAWQTRNIHTNYHKEKYSHSKSTSCIALKQRCMSINTQWIQTETQKGEESIKWWTDKKVFFHTGFCSHKDCEWILLLVFFFALSSSYLCSFVWFLSFVFLCHLKAKTPVNTHFSLTSWYTFLTSR